MCLRFTLITRGECYFGGYGERTLSESQAQKVAQDTCGLALIVSESTNVISIVKGTFDPAGTLGTLVNGISHPAGTL